MKTTNLTYPSHDGSTTIRAWLKEPDKVASGQQLPRAVIQVIHGAAEHSGRYARVAKLLVDKGFVVCAHDQIGHGASAEKADIGHIPLVGGQNDLVADVHSLRALVQPRYLESVPYVMLGHSMGSYVLRVYLAELGGGVAAAVLVGTSDLRELPMSLAYWVARRTARRQGERAFSERLHRMGLGGIGRRMKNRRTEFDWLCTDPAVVDAYIADPLCGFRLTNGAYATLAHLMRDISSNAVRVYTPRNVGILILSGADDPLSKRGKAPKSLAKLYRSSGVSNTEHKVYPGMRHEVLNEPGRRKVLGDIVDWLELRLGV